MTGLEDKPGQWARPTGSPPNGEQATDLIRPRQLIPPTASVPTSSATQCHPSFVNWFRHMRAGIAAFLLVLGAIAAVLTGVGQWAESNVLTTSGFVGNADSVLNRKPVQMAIARSIVQQLEDSAGRRLQLAEPFIRSIVESIVSSDAFQEVFDSAVSTTHHVFVTRDAEELVLNLTSTVDDIRLVLQEVSPGLADDLPKGKDLRITLAQRTQLPLIWDWVQTANRVIDSIYLVALALIGLGLLIAPFRWRSLALMGWSIATASIATMLALTITRQILLNRVPDPVYRAGAGSAWNALSHDLFVVAIVMAALGGAAATAARWTDNNGGTAVYPIAARRALQSARTVAAEGVGIGESEPLVPALTGLASAAFRWRIPAPERNVRLTHWWRAFGLGVAGALVLGNSDFVLSAIMNIGAIIALYLAATEGIASYRSPRVPTPTHPSLRTDTSH